MGNQVTTSKPTSDSESLHESMLREQSKDVFKNYCKVEVLGNGSMGAVCKVKVRENKVGGSAFHPKKQRFFQKQTSSTLSNEERRDRPVLYALKSIQLDRVSPLFLQELQNEISILKTMDHPNIVKAHEVYTSSKKQIFIVLELCDGGDLYKRFPYSEKDSAMHLGKLVSAVQYMHEQGIVHRDLKFENIMFESHEKDAEIKVIDFGLSKKFAAGNIGTMTEGVGTMYTMAPQVLQGVYTSQADLWSVGVIAFMMLSAKRPFYHVRRRVLIDRIMRAAYSMETPNWRLVSDKAKDFVSKLLVVNPKIRMNAAQAMQHEWFQEKFNLSDRRPDESVLEDVQESLVHYKQTSQLKRIALNVIAHRSATSEILELRKCFDLYDAGNNGLISFEEFKAALEKANFNEEVMKEIFASIDVNKNGHIQYTEFLAATLEAQGQIKEERIAEAFDRLDSDDSGYISKQNLRDFLGKDSTMEEVEAIINSADVDKDGQLSYQEFLDMFRKKTTENILKVGGQESFSEEGDEDLVGLDAVIPGGKYDTT